MNELLKEFATQAAQSVQERKSDYFLEKFAELIVKEYSKQLANIDSESYHGGQYCVIEKIEKHFGVGDE